MLTVCLGHAPVCGASQGFWGNYQTGNDGAPLLRLRDFLSCTAPLHVLSNLLTSARLDVELIQPPKPAEKAFYLSVFFTF